MNILEVQGTVSWAVSLLLIAVTGFAFVVSLLHPAPAYEAADKLNKPSWVAITGLGFAASLVLPGGLGLLRLAFTIAALVFIVDVRPALLEVTGRR